MGNIPSFVWIWAGAIVVCAVCALLYGVNKNKKLRAEEGSFLREHPDASKVYVMAKGYVNPEVVEIHTVDGQKPPALREAGKYGVWVMSGEHRLQLSFTNTRHRGVYMSVRSTGTVERMMDVKPATVYELSFDKGTGAFSLREAGRL